MSSAAKKGWLSKPHADSTPREAISSLAATALPFVLMYTFRGARNSSICDPFSAHWAADYPDVRVDGGDGAARRRLRFAGRFQPAKHATSERIQAELQGRRVPDYRDCGIGGTRRGAAVSRAGKPERVLCESLATAFQPVRFRMVWRADRRLCCASDPGTEIGNSAARISGYLLTGSVRRLRHRQDWLPAFRRQRLWRAHFAAVGNELSERRRADHGAGASHAHLRILGLAGDCRVPLAHGNKNAARAQSQGRDFLQLFDFDGRRAIPSRVYPHQPAFVVRHVERADRESSLHSCRRGVTLAY